MCVANRPAVSLSDLGGGATAVLRAVSLPLVLVDETQACLQEGERLAGVRVTDAAHWGTSAVLSFARSVNDTPKIVALGMASAAAVGVGAAPVYVVGAVAMAAGGIFAGRRVTRTLAERVTDVDPLEGLAASAVAAVLVLTAGFSALPVSTTHVATGALVGAGLRGGAGAIRWNTVAGLVAAWFVTLPVSAGVSAAAWRLGARIAQI